MPTYSPLLRELTGLPQGNACDKKKRHIAAAENQASSLLLVQTFSRRNADIVTNPNRDHLRSKSLWDFKKMKVKNATGILKYAIRHKIYSPDEIETEPD